MLSTIPITIEDYEPYTGGKSAPNPNYPQELVNIGDGGNVGINICQKNIFDFLSACESVNNITVADDIVSCAGWIMLNVYYKVPASLNGKTVSMSCMLKSTGEDTAYMRIRRYRAADSSDVSSGYIYANGGDFQQLTFTCEVQEGDRLGIAYGGTGGSAQIIYAKEFQIEIANTPTKYESYTEQTATFSTPNGLPGVPVSSGGNYTDENGQQYICDEIDGDSYIHRVVKYTFDGSEDWSYSTTGVSSFRLALPDIVDYRTTNIVNPMLCTHYPVRSSNAVYSGLDRCATIFGQIWISDSRYTDLNSWKSALSELNLSAIFILKEPIEEPLADNEILVYKALRTNKTVTNIFNDVNAHMKIDYVADPKTYIDNKIDEKYAILQSAILKLGGVI